MTSSRSGDAGLSPQQKRPWLLPLNNPPVAPGNTATHMRGNDPIVGIIAGGQARAYPWWILANYHLVNETLIVSDTPGGYLWTPEMTGTGNPGYPWFPTLPLVITLCEACSAAAAFVATPHDGQVSSLAFSLTEGARPGDYKAMGTFTIADLQTQSRWHPFTGYAHSGELKGSQLPRIPAFVDHWDAWLRDYPQTSVVLADEQMRKRPHVLDLPDILDPGVAHTSLRKLRVDQPELIDDRLPEFELVLGTSNTAVLRSVAVPVATLRGLGGVLQHDIAGLPVLFTLTANYRGLVFSRLVDGESMSFERADSADFTLLDQRGGRWNYLGLCTEGVDRGKQLALMPDGYLSKWGEWSLAHTGSEILD